MQRDAEVWAGKPLGSELSTTFTPMSDNWITDRVPTESDADPYGEVITRNRLNPDNWVHIHWSLIRPGNSWRRTACWEPHTEPVPPSELSLLSDFKVGQVWRTRKGKMCRIIKISSSDDSYPIKSDLYGCHWHFSNGRSILGGGTHHEDDLIELISEELVQEAPEPAPKPPAQPAAEIPELIRTGAAPFYVLIVSDDSDNGGDGNPITWETQIPEGSTLQAVLQQQSRVGSRYGTTHIAECRIIPELTREVPTDAG